MINALFKTELARGHWSKNSGLVSKYYDALVSFGFEYAIQHANEFKRATESYIAETEDGFEDDFYDDMFICQTFCMFLATYADYWTILLQKDYPESWNRLQDAIDCLRTLNRFSLVNKTSVFRFFEKQLQSLEILYPYRIFASIEVIAGRVECSICQKSIDSLECSHIQGELYRGKVAYGIVRDIKEFLSMSLVENPADKRCVMSEIEGKPIRFPCVEYLAKSMVNRKFNALMVSHTVKTTRKEFTVFENIPRNDKCPCGSGKKYKKCCLGKTIEKPHIEIILKEDRNGFSDEDLTTMALLGQEMVA